MIDCILGRGGICCSIANFVDSMGFVYCQLPVLLWDC